MRLMLFALVTVLCGEVTTCACQRALPIHSTKKDLALRSVDPEKKTDKCKQSNLCIDLPRPAARTQQERVVLVQQGCKKTTKELHTDAALQTRCGIYVSAQIHLASNISANQRPSNQTWPLPTPCVLPRQASTIPIRLDHQSPIGITGVSA